VSLKRVGIHHIDIDHFILYLLHDNKANSHIAMIWRLNGLSTSFHYDITSTCVDIDTGYPKAASLLDITTTFDATAQTEETETQIAGYINRRDARSIGKRYREGGE
jgi:hypothetical protein